MPDPTYPALKTHLDPVAADLHTSDQIANESSATGGTVTAALNHIHNTRPSADNVLTAGDVLIGAGDGHLEASGVQLSSLATDAEVSAAISAHEGAANPHPGYLTPAEGAAAYSPLAHASATNNPHAVTKAQVGLGNVDNTADADKPISTATQTALNGKLASTFTKAQLDTAVTDGNVQFVGDAPTAHAHAIADVTGLQTVLDGKEPTIAAGTTGQYWRGDKTWQTLPGGVTDHGALTGLGDDDHTQYHTDARGDSRYSLLGHNHSGVYDPAGTAASAVSTHAALADGTAHSISGVSGLQSALDGKASTAHTHSAADITSGTLDSARLAANLGTGKTVNGVTLETGGASGQYLSRDGTYTTPAGGSEEVINASGASLYELATSLVPGVYELNLVSVASATNVFALQFDGGGGTWNKLFNYIRKNLTTSVISAQAGSVYDLPITGVTSHSQVGLFTILVGASGEVTVSGALSGFSSAVNTFTTAFTTIFQASTSAGVSGVSKMRLTSGTAAFTIRFRRIS